MGRTPRRNSRGRLPASEVLEARRVPAQFGVPWHDGDHLSISFVPDGTHVAGRPSDLFRTLDAREPRAAWQGEILRAFQSWAVQAHLNVALVPDGGEPLGTPGPDQHDPRFGDVRIAAVPLSPGALSISIPHDPFLSGTWSGDALLNDTVAFDDGGPGLFQAMLHEAGHVLGIDHSDDPASVMAEHLDNAMVALAPSDVAAIRALYGPRGGDPYEGPAGNETPATASPLPAPAGYDGTTPLFLYADVSSPGDSDVYSIRAPGDEAGPMTVRLQTSGVSLLEPRLTVYDPAGRVLADLAGRGEAGDTLRYTLPRLEPGATYSVQARAAAGGLSGVGEYALAVTFDAKSTVAEGVIDRLARQSYAYLSPEDIDAIFRDPAGALFGDDHHANDTFATAAVLEPAGDYGSEAPARVTASLGVPADVDVYRIETPEAEPGDGSPRRPLVMTVTGRATEVNGVMPRVEVFDASRSPVPAVVLARGGGTYAIQVEDARPGTAYFFRVAPDPSSGKVVGNYELDAEYGHVPARPADFAASTIDGTGAPVTYGLRVDEPQLFDFLLAAWGEPGADRPVSMSVFDDSGRVVASRAAGSGETAGGDPVLLAPGSYRVEFSAPSAGGGGRPLAFRLYGASLSDPVGPATDDPTRRRLAAPSYAGADPLPPAFASAGSPYRWVALSLSTPRGSPTPPTGGLLLLPLTPAGLGAGRALLASSASPGGLQAGATPGRGTDLDARFVVATNSNRPRASASLAIPAGPLGGSVAGEAGRPEAGLWRAWPGVPGPLLSPRKGGRGPLVVASIFDPGAAPADSDVAVASPPVLVPPDRPEEANLGVDRTSVVAVLGLARFLHSRAGARRVRGISAPPIDPGSPPGPSPLA